MALQWLEDHGLPTPTLILCPKTLIRQWGNEIEKHTDWDYIILGSDSKEVRGKKKLIFEDRAPIVITNYEAFMGARRDVITGTAWGALIIDESTAFKNPRTLRFKHYKKLLVRPQHRLLLSGAPILEDLMDIWSQMYMMDFGKTFGDNFWKFRTEYFNPGPPWKPFEWVPKRDAVERITEKLRDSCILVSKDEVENELPEKRYIRVELPLPMPTRIAYEELRKQFRLELDGQLVVDTMWAAVRANKLHQMAQGFLYGQEGGEALWLHNQKGEWLAESIRMIVKTGPTIVWVPYKAQLERLHQELEVSHVVLHGDMTQEERNASVECFKKGGVDVIIMTIAAGYAGLNLPEASNAIFLGCDFSASHRMNAEDRCHRVDSKHKCVTYYDVVCAHTIDVHVLDVLSGKAELADEVVKHLKE